LPHITAAALTNLVLNPSRPKPQSALCAGGFRDMTRIASGSPEMWRDIALANKKNLARSLGDLIGELQRFQRLLQKQDAKAIARFLERAKQRRDSWCTQCASPSSE
jgi:prephenate dehydrogenase